MKQKLLLCIIDICVAKCGAASLLSSKGEGDMLARGVGLRIFARKVFAQEVSRSLSGVC